VKKILEIIRNKTGIELRTQNLDNQPGDDFDASGSILRHGRLWLSRYRDRNYHNLLQFSWVTRFSNPGVRVSIEQEDGPSFSMSGPLGSYYFSFPTRTDRFLQAFQKLAGVGQWEDVTIFNLYTYQGSLSWKVMGASDSWDSKIPRWRDGNFDYYNLIFKQTMTDEPIVEGSLSPRNINIPMPEGVYQWKIQFQRRVLKRRFLRKKSFVTYNAECHEGQQIPKPGKGENSWDCGPDAIFGQSGPGSSVTEAIAKIVQGVLRDRERYGSGHTYVDGGIYDEKLAS
jgi:hypothetical protein